jgi:hypothetical protein
MAKALIKVLRSGGVWLLAGFVGLMFATAITGPIPSAADWQSSIVCGAGTHLTHAEYVYERGPEQAADGSETSGGTSHGFTYHCAGATSFSGSRTPIVLGLQFMAATLVTVLLCLFFTARSTFRAKRAPVTA